jgi:hypothetical protein
MKTLFITLLLTFALLAGCGERPKTEHQTQPPAAEPIATSRPIVEPTEVEFYTSYDSFLGAKVAFETTKGTEIASLPVSKNFQDGELARVMIKNPGSMSQGYTVFMTLQNGEKIRFATLTRVTESVYLLIHPCFTMPEAFANGGFSGGDQIAFPAWFKPGVPKPPRPDYHCGDWTQNATPYTKK